MKNWLIIVTCLIAAAALHFAFLTYQTNTIITHSNGTVTQTVSAKPVFGTARRVTIPAGTFEVGKPPPSTIATEGAYPRGFVTWEAAVVGGLIIPGILLLLAGARLVGMTRGWLCIAAGLVPLLAAVAAGAYAYVALVGGVWTTFFIDLLADQPGEASTVVTKMTNGTIRIAEVAALILLVSSIVIVVRGWRTRRAARAQLSEQQLV